MAIDRRRMMGGYLPLREAIDRMFEGSFISPRLLDGQNGFPQANVQVTDDSVIVEMAIPGVDPRDVNISVTGDTLTVSGETKSHQKEGQGQTYVEEIWEGNFQRSVLLPFPVDADKAQATCENGILKLTLPKAEHARPRRIQVGGISKQQLGSTQQGSSSTQRQEQIESEKVPAGSGSRP